MWELDCEESWAPKNWCFWTVVLESSPTGELKDIIMYRPWCWERLKAGGEGDDRGWDGWMASLTRWIWVWVNSGSWWWTGRPGVLWFMGSQRVGQDWATKLNWTELNCNSLVSCQVLCPILQLLSCWLILHSGFWFGSVRANSNFQ